MVFMALPPYGLSNIAVGYVPRLDQPGTRRTHRRQERQKSGRQNGCDQQEKQEREITRHHDAYDQGQKGRRQRWRKQDEFVAQKLVGTPGHCLLHPLNPLGLANNMPNLKSDRAVCQRGKKSESGKEN
jgi:hypothetical protein